MATRNESLHIDISMPCPDWKKGLPGIDDLCRQSALAAFEEGISKNHSAGLFEISLVLANDSFIQPLNKKYRGRNTPTNVLSFALCEGEKEHPLQEAPKMLGDVILAYETARTEAQTEGKPFSDHISHLVVHGVLHLLGYDHQTGENGNAMEKLEIQALANLNITDPYDSSMGIEMS